MEPIIQNAELTATSEEVIVTPQFLVGVETQLEFLSKLQGLGLPAGRYVIKATDASASGKMFAFWDNEPVQRFTPMVSKANPDFELHVQNCVQIINTK